MNEANVAEGIGRRRSREEPWTFTKEGAYGSFSTGGSLPLEFIQTTFAIGNLPKLTFARDVAPDSLDFEMLMQRDIDEVRANRKLKAYLNPLPGLPNRAMWQSVFFPPLLIACVACRSKVIQHYYPDENTATMAENKLVRRWGEMFQLEFFTTASIGSLYELRSPCSDESWSVDLNGVILRLNLSQAFEDGVKLIAIDGQHRLYALSELAKQSEDSLSKLVIPACILFSTSATQASLQYHSSQGAQDLPGVPETFRKVFVDVNSKVELVGAHTNILLNDTNVGSLIVRDFCSLVNKSEGKEGLSCVEWNVKNVKDSTILSRKYSIASIGILHLALEECFAPRPLRRNAPSLMRQLLDIEDVEIEKRLRQLADDPENPDVSWENFSIAQRSILAERARAGIVQVVFELVFHSEPYRRAYEHYKAALDRELKLGKDNTERAPDHRGAYEAITNFREPRPDYAESRIVRNLGRDEENWRKEQVSPVMHFALFQRSVFLTLRELMVAFPDLDIRSLGDALVRLLERSMDGDRALFARGQDYTRKTIWTDTGNVVNRENTRRQMSRLTLGVLGAREEAEAIVNSLDVAESEKDGAVRRLIDVGEEQIEAFWRDYTRDSERHFRRAFDTSYGLDEGEIDRLRRARIAQEHEDEELKADKLRDEDAERPFDVLVKKHLADDFEAAEAHLRDVLKLERRIVGLGLVEEDENNGD